MELHTHKSAQCQDILLMWIPCLQQQSKNKDLQSHFKFSLHQGQLSSFTKVVNASCTALNQIITIPYRLCLTSTLLLSFCLFFFKSITVLNYCPLQHRQCCKNFRDKTLLPTTASRFIVSGNFNSFLCHCHSNFYLQLYVVS